MHVDRFMAAAMHYPCDYGYIPQTLSEDGDPLDVLVACPYPLIPGVVIRCRAIGLLRMSMVVLMPSCYGSCQQLTPLYDHIKEPVDLGQHFLDRIEHFLLIIRSWKRKMGQDRWLGRFLPRLSMRFKRE